MYKAFNKLLKTLNMNVHSYVFVYFQKPNDLGLNYLRECSQFIHTDQIVLTFHPYPFHLSRNKFLKKNLVDLAASVTDLGKGPWNVNHGVDCRHTQDLKFEKKLQNKGKNVNKFVNTAII